MARIHCITYFNESDADIGLHELVDVEYFCSAFCMRDALDELSRERGFRGGPLDKPADDVEWADGSGGIGYGEYPCGDETDACTYCATCEEHLRCGITERTCSEGASDDS